MNRRGLTYDTGIVLSGRRGGGIPTRPKLDIATSERELQIVREGLHCNAVRLIGRDVDRLLQVAERALALDLEVWLSPALWGRSAEETLHFDVSAPSGPSRYANDTPTVSYLSWGAS